MSKDRASLVTRRYRLLIEQLGEDRGSARGWKRRVSEQLGVHPSYVSKILAGSKTQVGEEVVDRACERLGLSREFFGRDSAGDHYSDFQLGSSADPWAGVSAEVFSLSVGVMAAMSVEPLSPDRAARVRTSLERTLRVLEGVPVIRAYLDATRALDGGTDQEVVDAAIHLAVAVGAQRRNKRDDETP
ncbi:MAG: hypothetical protein SangKO_086980 [Sandaracinaceae bacterium]